MLLSLILIGVVAYVALLLPVAVVIGRTLRGPVQTAAVGGFAVGEPYPASARVHSLMS